MPPCRRILQKRPRPVLPVASLLGAPGMILRTRKQNWGWVRLCTRKEWLLRGLGACVCLWTLRLLWVGSTRVCVQSKVLALPPPKGGRIKLAFMVWFHDPEMPEVKQTWPALQRLGYDVSVIGTLQIMMDNNHSEAVLMSELERRLAPQHVILFWNWDSPSKEGFAKLRAMFPDKVFVLYNFDDPHVWSSDATPHRRELVHAIAPLMDLVFTTGSAAVSKYTAAGAKHAEFIMPPWSREFHFHDYDPELARTCDVNFVLVDPYIGYKHTTIDRLALLDALHDDVHKRNSSLKVHIYGYGPMDKHKERYGDLWKGSMQFAQGRKIFSSCTLSLNTLANDGMGGRYANSRTSFVMASGGVMLADASPGWKGILTDGKDSIIMRSSDPRDVVAQIHDILDNRQNDLAHIRAGAMSTAQLWEANRFAEQVHRRVVVALKQKHKATDTELPCLAEVVPVSLPKYPST